MNQDFIEFLCEQEKLIDIGNQGKASQSSRSKWSKGNDAQRAVNNKEYSDYAFHTDREINPWWQIEFEKPFSIEYIIINNRKSKPFDEICSSLKVIGYNENNLEINLFTGTSFFGSVPKELPLIFSLQGKINLKKIRIILLKHDYLHLTNIRFLVKDALKSQEKNLVFVANRHDGMGERLRAILNAMVLAKENDGSFLFTWKTNNLDFHATSEKNLIFNCDFQKKYLIDGQDLNNLKIHPIEKTPFITAKDFEDYKGVLVQQNEIVKMLPYPYANFDSKNYQTAFNEIGFSDQLIAAKSHAESIEITSKAVAIHIRAGDIVYGQYRDMPIFYGKVTPFYLLDHVIKILVKAGSEIIIFGQDDVFCRYLADKYDALYSKELLRPEYNDSQIALFDVILMSKCKEVIAGHSGFSTLSEWIGGAQIKNCYQYFSGTEAVINEFKDFLYNKESFFQSDKIDSSIKAFSISHFVNRYQKHIPLIDKIAYLEDCISLDPKGSYNKVFLASLYYNYGDIMKGDSILIDKITVDNINWLEKLARMVHWNNTTPISHLMDDFKIAATKGSIVASLILLLNDIYYTKSIDAEFYRDILQKNDENAFGVSLISEYLRNMT